MKIVKTIEPCGVAIIGKVNRIFRTFKTDDDTAQEIQKLVGTVTDVLADESPLSDVDCNTIETVEGEFFCTLSVETDDGDELFFSSTAFENFNSARICADVLQAAVDCLTEENADDNA